jgi:predicted nucleic acid-binding protein
MIAIDTNVLVYCVDPRDPTKRQKARDLINALTGSSAVLLPWQVLVEYVNQLRHLHRLGIISEADRDLAIRSSQVLFPVVCPAFRVMIRTLDLLRRHSLSYFDALLLGACIDAGIHTLYTEDMGAPVQYDSVQLINPFV